MFGLNFDKSKTNSANAGRTTGVCPAPASSAHAAKVKRVAGDCPAPSKGSYVIQNKSIFGVDMTLF